MANTILLDLAVMYACFDVQIKLQTDVLTECNARRITKSVNIDFTRPFWLQKTGIHLSEVSK